MYKFLIFFLICEKLIFPQDSDFLITAQKSKTYFPTYIGNGNFSISSSQLGTLPTESYMIKVYDRGKDDIPRIACLPEWNEINYFNGTNWLNDINPNNSSEVINYAQKLDMYNGWIETNYSWNVDNKKTDVHVLTFISRKNQNLAVIKFDFFTSEFPLSVLIIFSKIPIF